MEHSVVGLMDLPDEIIIIILNKLDNVEVLYSLIDVNTRLNKIVQDSIFTTKITLMKSTYRTLTLSDKMLERFCSQILPKIHHQVKWLNLESASMERILLAGDYPNLCQLDIFIIDKEPALLLTEVSSLVRIFQNQIVTLSVTGAKGDHDAMTMNKRANLFSYILTTFTNILHLKFYQSTSFILFNEPCTSFSSTLVELHINVYLFDDCLYQLDGRLNQLRTLIVNVSHIFPLRSTINNKNELTNLKYFSLTSYNETAVYDELIVSNIRRMSNLENLSLSLLIECEERFIDGNDLKNSIINHLSKLNEFLFNIRSIISLDNSTQVQSNENIHRTLTGLSDHQIISCIDYFPSDQSGQCHFYTHPYTMLRYENISNSFPGGLFKCVRVVTLFDERPFEHTFFIQITQAFPYLEELSVSNRKPQNQKLNNDNEHFPIIEYPHLRTLRLIGIHDDYTEQFLFDIKTCLSNFIFLVMDYNQLQRITHNFTRDATRFNCSKVDRFSSTNQPSTPKHFDIYFPHMK